MSYAASPLTESQSQALIQILAQTSDGNNPGNGPRGVVMGNFGGNFGGPRVAITDEMIAQAQTILSPAQVKVLQDQQATQQNERKLRELMRPPGQARRAN